MRLLPHQVGLVETFFNPGSKRVVVLRAEVGLGKSSALVALVSRLLRERPSARVLFLVAAAALRTQFVEMLHEADVPTLSVDRYRYRELLDAAAGKEIWPAGAVVVLTREFARQEDVRGALTTRWDLLVLDEAHQFGGALAKELVRTVSQASERVVLTILPNLNLPDAFPEDDATVVQWRREQVVDHDGKPLDVVPRPSLHLVSFTLSPAELILAQTVSEACRILEAGTTEQRWVARSLLHSLQSSPAALENGLRRIAEAKNAAAQSGEALLEPSEEDSLGDQFRGWVDRPSAEKVAGIATRALSELEAIRGDSKFAAFGGLLTHLTEVKTSSPRICVLTEYLSTLFYLAAEIENLGQTCHVLHGGMNTEGRQRSLALFSDGGILASTRAAISEGVALGQVTDLILYDIPGAKLALHQVLGRFDRLGRRTQLRVHALAASNSIDGFVDGALELLREVLSVPA
jgi:hypothetical protein